MSSGHKDGEREETSMRAPLIAVGLAAIGAIFLCASAFLGVTAYADWTMFAAEASLVTAVIVFLGWFVVGCIGEIRKV
jgi:hypothetical protein